VLTQAPDSIERELETHRPALTGYCYRMLGSGFEAEDAVQETMVRAWKASDRLQSRAALKSWLYRIATNVCFDMLQGAQRRARPIDLESASTPEGVLGAGLPEDAWIHPIADAKVLPEGGDPAEVAAAKETIRLAFVATLQHLPPKQRAVLILCEVLHWRAKEVAELLDTSVASVNSALQRARATLAQAGLDAEAQVPPSVDREEHKELLAKYLDAFERYDIGELVSLLHEDATQSMPPWSLWLRGRDHIAAWFTGQGAACEGSKLVPIEVNGRLGYGQYKHAGDGVYEPWSICVVEIEDGKITALQNFIYPHWFPAFGLAPRLVRGEPVWD
jgi:RNA polymerase sigma-70 factor, ECF subfamily